MEERALKMMAYAIDSAAGDEESKNAWEMARQEIRRLNLTIGDLTKSQPSPFDLVVGFGKYEGKTLGEIYRRDCNYIQWIATTPKFSNAILKQAAEQIMRGKK